MAKGARGNPCRRGARIVRSDNPTAQTLDELGISKDQSAQWAKLAEIPDDDFETLLMGMDHPSTEGLIRRWEEKLGISKSQPVASEALWLWGRLRDFERDGFLARMPAGHAAPISACPKDRGRLAQGEGLFELSGVPANRANASAVVIDNSVFIPRHP
jgi:hypothetical protein